MPVAYTIKSFSVIIKVNSILQTSITLEEYEKDKLYASHAKADRSKSDIVSVAEALLKGADNERLIQELDGLEELIKARREKIKQEGQ